MLTIKVNMNYSEIVRAHSSLDDMHWSCCLATVTPLHVHSPYQGHLVPTPEQMHY